MKAIALLIIAVAAPLAGIASARTAPSSASVLRGRVAQPPQQCLSPTAIDGGSRTFDDGSVLFEGRGSTVYLNRPQDCTILKANRTIVTRQTTGTLCRGDIVRVVDPSGPVELGACTLGDFIPYRRTARRPS